jgi:hypothetical protein
MSTVLKLGPGDHGRPMSLDEVGPGDRYTTRLLPGFTLRVDPRS